MSAAEAPNTKNDRTAAAEAWRRALELTAPIGQHPMVTLPVVIDRLADKFGDAPALLGDRENLGYRALAERAAQYARWALAQRIAPGDVVCLLMPNCPEYLAIWLGITRVGGVVALINTNLVGDALRHAIDIAAPRYAIVEAGLGDAFALVRPRLAGPVEAWAHGSDGHGWPRIDRALESLSAARVDQPAPNLADRALYIYTSGTTGLPKAASVSHYRVMQWSHWFAGLIDARPSDRMYNCLPLYHSIGGVVATCAPLVGGGSVVIRERFSASRFWDDVADHGCTLFQYIGELCRYLVASPPHPREAQHRLRLACGNGMRPDVWPAFQERFDIPRILEFYAATEGSFSLDNCEGKSGAIGRIPPFLTQHRPGGLGAQDPPRCLRAGRCLVPHR
jgi:fatty-acyl-CoA synthase